ncbi:hypothetical protein DPMN_123415 [Dreissena polymorpha]|uniref:Uncharacterized protein n=2 Tax=Dreissena polymorpha TaxID=45954 RepID=A0A9D4GRA2_DREPO|nr:hypothetical protein DPMN_123415 [Dreissena polymorpha]
MRSESIDRIALSLHMRSDNIDRIAPSLHMRSDNIDRIARSLHMHSDTPPSRPNAAVFSFWNNENVTHSYKVPEPRDLFGYVWDIRM